MDDFIFGSLGTEAKRLAHVRGQRAGVTHLQRRSPRDPAPGQAVTLELSLGPAYPQDRAWAYWTADGSDPAGAGGVAAAGQVAALTPVDADWDTLVWGYVRRFRGVLPGQPAGTVVRYRLAAGGRGPEVWADAGAYYGYYVDDDPPPAWTRDAILYQIFADRFFSADPDFPQVEAKPSHKANGTLRGITAQLGYIAALGANCLWITPVFPSPSYHGYDATDFFGINPRLGTPADYQMLIDQAHARGMRVLMDFVPNHWSDQHASFQAALRDPNSPSAAWYTFKHWPDDYETFFGVKDLPQLNLRHPAARAHVLDAAKYWLDFGVDGFRVDYCIGPTPDFYADFRRVTRAANPECWTFGEAVDPPDSQLTFAGGMDGALDFMLLEALRQTFAYGEWDAARLADFLDRHEAYYPPDYSRPSFLDNHDMNRFLWAAQGDQRRLRLAALCQFTLAGPPIIYYGTEVGLSQDRDIRQGGWALHEEARLPMPWGEAQNAGLLTFYRDLAWFRRQTPALRGGTRETLVAEGRLLAYRRADAAGRCVTVLNLDTQPAALTLAIPETAVALTTDSACQAAAGADGVRVSLPPLAGVLLTI